MCTDFNLVRAHFQSALATLAQLNDFTSPEEGAQLLDLAALAHGAGARRLGRLAETPWLGPQLVELHQLEERVRRAISRADQELRRPHYMSQAAQ